MKKILVMFAFAAIVAGCNSNANENAKINQDSIRMVQDKIRLDSFERAEAAAIAAVAAERDNNKTQNRTQTRTRYVSSGTVHHTTAAPQPAQKKGWSSAAKGAVIGGAVGAGTGILVDKKDGRGAVIGGVVGTGTGYVIGRQKDKKTGRANQ